MIVQLAPPIKIASGKPWKDAPFAFCVNKQTEVIHTQVINPWTHGFNEKQIAAQAKMRETNRRVHEILEDPKLRAQYEAEQKVCTSPEKERRLRDYVFRKLYRGGG